MELTLTTDLDKCLPATIDFNFEEIKSYLQKNLKKYTGLVVTEDAISDAKKGRATLNKLKTAIDDRRKEIKKQYLVPYEYFDKQIKELLEMIDQPVAAIDGQVKAFENADKQAKIDAATAFYKDNIKELAALLPFEKIKDPRWENATFKPADIEKAILEKIDNCRRGLKVIQELHFKYEVEVQEVFLQSLDLSLALSRKAQLEQRERELATMQEEAQINLAPVSNVPVTADPPVQEAAETLQTVRVEFFNTTAAFRADMKALTTKHNIKYGGIK